MRAYLPKTQSAARRPSSGKQLPGQLRAASTNTFSDNRPHIQAQRQLHQLIAKRHVAIPSATIQRKFGFEFQVSENKFVDGEQEQPQNLIIEQNHQNNDHAVKHIREKEVAYDDPGKFKLEGDDATEKDSQLEFITYPVDTVEALKTAINTAAELAEALKMGKRDKEQRVAFSGNGWTRPVLIDIQDNTFSAEPQMSIGVELKDIPGLLHHTQQGKNSNREKDIQNHQKFIEINKLENVSQHVLGFITLIDHYIDWAGNAMNFTLQPEEKKEQHIPEKKKKKKFSLSNLFSKKKTKPKDEHQIIENNHPKEFLWMSDDFNKTKGNPEEAFFIDGKWHNLYLGGPKERFRVMARTDFRSMFLSLKEIEQNELLDLIPAIFKSKTEKPLLKTPYLADGSFVKEAQDNPHFKIEMYPNGLNEKYPVVVKSPTVEQWLDSIFAKSREKFNSNKDLLSAPPGWQGNKTDQMPTKEDTIQNGIYGMGAYPMDDNKAVFEIRDIGKFGGGKVPSNNWADWAINMVIRAINERFENDPRKKDKLFPG